MSSGGSDQIQANSVPPMLGYLSVMPLAPRKYRYSSQQSKGLGITLIVIGVLAFIFNGDGFAVSDLLAFVGHGFWCGALVCIVKYIWLIAR